nr:uncharacterized protein LOC111419385 [Onthophagus taurus]
MSEERRNSLLQLVTRLQQGLSSQLTPSSSYERRSSLQGNLSRRKQNRHSRHTVGVTSEELEDARRLMEEIGLGGMPQEQNVVLGSVKVKNSIAKPFISTQSSQSQSGTSSTVDTPTETSESIDFGNSKELKVFNNNKKESDTDEDSTIKIKNGDKQQPKPDLIMQTNPIYHQNRSNEESDDEFNNQYNEKANRFNTKKLKMKRANTIDIPKPLKYYECDDDESENEEIGRRNSYLALRGPIHVGKFNVSKKVPQFEAKTENDKKFLAFINKQNDGDQNPPIKTPWIKSKSTPIWSNHNSQGGLGKIKSNFEPKSPTANVNSARNFWKSADDAVTAGKQKTFGPKISRQSARNLQEMFEEKQRKNREDKWNDKNVVTGSLKVDTKNLETNKIKVIAQPNPVNKFSYNPMMSAFRPVKPQKNLYKENKESDKEIKELKDGVSYLYSPKPFSPQDSPSSPVGNTPWCSKSNENSRVLSIAASRFENQKGMDQKPLNSPNIVKNLNQNRNSVRKLSGQYDSLSQNLNYNQRVFIPGENYTISYQNQPQEIKKPNIYNAEYTITQKINFPVPIVSNVANNVVDDVVSDEVEHNLKQQELLESLRFNQPDFVQDTKSGFEHQNVNAYQPSYESDYNKYQGDDKQFTSNYQFKPDLNRNEFMGNKQNNYFDDESSPNQFSRHPQGDFQKSYHQIDEVQKDYHQKQLKNLKNNDNYQINHQNDHIQEHTPVNSRVMTGPIGQQAVMVQSNSPKKREEHDFDLALNLRSSLQKLSQTQNQDLKEPKSPTSKGLVVYNNVAPNLSPTRKPMVCLNDKPMESLEINEDGESVLTSKFHIQVKKPDLQANVLSKSESWHQICQGKELVANKPSPRASPNSRLVTRSKSSHSLAVPKQYEAGMSKQEMAEKQKSLEAYFGGKNQNQFQNKPKSSINRVKTSQKISTQRSQSISSSSTSLERSFTQGPVTTTSQVTSRVTTEQITKKPMSPFAKFRQLDKQNSLNSPPSTPKTPTGSGSFFKFTDPALNQSANTIKQRLLQWCQRKTYGYQNVQLDNFSTSWADGMAFCALIHHFLPEAFDYDALNPKNRRHNFTLAFQTAEDKAGIAPLLDVDDMVAISKPDWKCVFTYVQAIYRRFKDED